MSHPRSSRPLNPVLIEFKPVLPSEMPVTCRVSDPASHHFWSTATFKSVIITRAPKRYFVELFLSKTFPKNDLLGVAGKPKNLLKTTPHRWETVWISKHFQGAWGCTPESASGPTSASHRAKWSQNQGLRKSFLWRFWLFLEFAGVSALDSLHFYCPRWLNVLLWSFWCLDVFFKEDE